MKVSSNLLSGEFELRNVELLTEPINAKLVGVHSLALPESVGQTQVILMKSMLPALNIVSRLLFN